MLLYLTCTGEGSSLPVLGETVDNFDELDTDLGVRVAEL